jgi:hypothetical protein
MGPAFYIVTASNLRPTSPGYLMHKYAGDIYLVVPATNSMTCAAEIDNVERCADTEQITIYLTTLLVMATETCCAHSFHWREVTNIL